MEKDNYRDAYDGDTTILNAGDRGSGLQNDVFATSAPNGFEASKYFRAEGSVSTEYSSIAGYYVVDNKGSKVTVYDESGNAVGKISSGALIYNHALRSPDNSTVKIIVDDQEGYVNPVLFSWVKPITVQAAEEIFNERFADEFAVFAPAMHAEGEMNAAGASQAIDRSALSALYKTLVSNVNAIKKSLNERKISAARVYIQNAKKDLENLEKQLK